MNSDSLSLRLGAVARYIKGKMLADIGSDHAYLPCYAIRNGKVVRAIAGEVVVGPYDSARKEVALQALDPFIDVRLGSGFSVLSEADAVDCVTICGMGGGLIAQILNEGQHQLRGHERLILQPNLAGELVRKFLDENGWGIIAEEIILEDEKIYEIIVAEKMVKKAPLSALEILCGPKLINVRNDVFEIKWKRELAHFRRILHDIDASSQENARNEERKRELQEKIDLIESLRLE